MYIDIGGWWGCMGERDEREREKSEGEREERGRERALENERQKRCYCKGKLWAEVNSVRKKPLTLHFVDH